MKFVITKDPMQMVALIRDSMRNRVMRIAMNKAAAQAKAAVIDNAPARTGALKQSIKIRLKQYADGARWVAIIGPSRKFKRTLVRKSKNREGKYYRPARIAHLIEKASRFVSRAESSTHDQFLQTLCEKVGEQVQAILSR